MMRYRVGKRETFIEKAHGVLYSGRKTRATQAGFIGACVLALTFGVGATLSGVDLAIDTPLSPTVFPASPTGKIPTFIAMTGLALFAYTNATKTADSWWLDETGITRKKREAKK